MASARQIASFDSQRVRAESDAADQKAAYMAKAEYDAAEQKADFDSRMATRARQSSMKASISSQIGLRCAAACFCVCVSPPSIHFPSPCHPNSLLQVAFDKPAGDRAGHQQEAIDGATAAADEEPSTCSTSCVDAPARSSESDKSHYL